MGLRLMIVAGEAAADPEQVPAGIRVLTEAAETILVIAPRLPGRLEWIASDTDRATQRADERLRTVLGHLDEMGTPARGAVGSDDVLDVFTDGIRKFDPDHLLVALRPIDRSGWQEQ